MNQHKHDHAVSAKFEDSDLKELPVSPALLEDLVVANHILFNQGVLDSFGHVSVRHDKDPSRYLLCRNMAPALVSADDIIQYDLDSKPINSAGRPVYLERFIHGEIYKARPDIVAVVHSHSPSVVPFSVVKETALRPVCHMAGFLGAGAPVFEISDFVGDGSNLLVTNSFLGQSLATTLSDASIVLMRGHGSTVVADDLRKAVYRAVYAETNARTQIQSLMIGTPRYLSTSEAMSALETIETQVSRAWNLWSQQAESSQL